MNYVTEIADLYLALNPKKQILDGTDYTMIAEWEKQEIPLFIVRSSIQQICDNKGDDNQLEVASLIHVNPAVKESFRCWLQNAEVA